MKRQFSKDAPEWKNSDSYNICKIQMNRIYQDELDKMK